jgi:aminoglycoside 6'-N-acetyltransferase I
MAASCVVRRAVPEDLDALARLRTALWPDGTLAEHASDAALVLAGQAPSTMPLVDMVAEVDGVTVGFIEVGLRSHADGCDTARPVGFVEGWYVDPEHRGAAVGRALMRAAEEWAIAEGCYELASDTWIDSEPSQRAHEALGFVEVDRCVNYRKSLR